MNKKIVIPFLVITAVIIIIFLLFNNLETYFTGLLNELAGHKEKYAAASVLVLTADIVLPVPSSIVMYTNGYVLGIGYGAAVSLIAHMIGSVIGYYIGRFTSRGIRNKKNPTADNLLSKYGAPVILVSRGIPVIAESISIICGYDKMPFRKYLLFNLIGYLPLCLLYAYCGSLGYDKNIFLLSFGCSLVIAGVFWFIGKKFLERAEDGA